jgi:hypothetical protein
MIRLKNLMKGNLNEAVSIDKLMKDIQSITDQEQLYTIRDFVINHSKELKSSADKEVKMTKLDKGTYSGRPLYRYEFKGTTYEAVPVTTNINRYKVFKMEKFGTGNAMKRGEVVKKEFGGSAYELRSAIASGRVK